MSESIDIHQAQTQLSKLLSRVALGEEFTIANRGVPIAKLIGWGSFKVKINNETRKFQEDTATFYQVGVKTYDFFEP